MTIKCIKDKCSYYFNSDIFEKCSLEPEYIINNNCVGFEKIKAKKEGIIYKISTLLDEYNKLEYLESHIKNNQGNLENND